MSTEIAVRRSRRAVLASALVAAASGLGLTLGRAGRVAAADGDTVRLGEENAADAPTRLSRSSAGPVLMADAPGPGVGVTGTTSSGIGVYGIAASGKAVLAQSESGSALEAWSASGVAVRIRHGRMKADAISGVALIPAGETESVVRPRASVERDAFVLLTPMADLGRRGLWFSTQPQDGTITVHMGGRPLKDDVRVAWLMLG